MKEYDLIIIGGGISGISAAVAAKEEGVKNILIMEREDSLGGILNQCIHVGFGKEFIGYSVTGPEFIDYFESKLDDITVLTETEVLDISNSKIVTFVNPREGLTDVKGKTILLATGCREKYVGSVNIATNDYTGIFTIGNAHRIMNLEGYLPGKNVVILANNLWSLIVARRLIIESANVEGIIVTKEFMNTFEIEGINIIEGFNIPVYEQCNIVSISGKERIEGVTIYSEETNDILKIKCDCLLLSVVYSPENYLCKKLNIELGKNQEPLQNNYKTELPGFFVCGSLIYGNSSVNIKGINGYEAGKIIAKYLKEY